MRAIIKCSIEYIFDLFSLIELVLNGHTRELIEEEVWYMNNTSHHCALGPKQTKQFKSELTNEMLRSKHFVG